MRNWFTMKAEEGVGEIAIYDEIGKSFWGDETVSAKSFLDTLAALGPVNAITLRINSPGGDVFDGLAIHNALKNHAAKVTARIDGLAASAASYIAMAADKIVMPANSFMLVHQSAGFALGTADDMRALADDLERIDNSITATYVARTGMTTGEVKALMKEDRLMGAAEAKELGFADEVERAGDDDDVAAADRAAGEVEGFGEGLGGLGHLAGHGDEALVEFFGLDGAGVGAGLGEDDLVGAEGDAVEEGVDVLVGGAAEDHDHGVVGDVCADGLDEGGDGGFVVGAVEEDARVGPRHLHAAGEACAGEAAGDAGLGGVEAALAEAVERREGEAAWKTLRKSTSETILVWDTTTVPNGTYFVRIVASDAPSNPSGTALAGELDSVAFEVDNTAPTITVGTIRVERGRTIISFDVKDDHSPVQHVEFSQDGQRWRGVFPVDGIADSREEHYELVVDGELGDRGLTLRASDSMNNVETIHVDAPRGR
jgi:ATP-dependent protease ClpP protease subunit